MFKLFKGSSGSGAAPTAASPEPAEGACAACGEERAAPSSGCVVCGKDLVYAATSERLTCATCGAVAESTARCAAGHFVCDGCHAAPAKDLIARTCVASEDKDPMAIALRILREPAMKLHGPEHHFLVPAVLVTAFSNAKGEGSKRAERVAEARRRSDPILGGFCGTQGACGAAIGAGTFVSIVTGSTPLKGKERGLANRMTSRALAVIGATDGSRCCRRDSMLAILAAVKFAHEHLKTQMPTRGPSCEWSSSNKDCVGAACPFNR